MKTLNGLYPTISAAILMSLLAACASKEKIQTSKEENYDRTPKNVFMIYPQGPRTKSYGPTLDQSLKQYFTNCDIAYGSDYEMKASDTVKGPNLNDMKTTMAAASQYDWALEITVSQDEYAQPTRYGVPYGTPMHIGVTNNYTLMDTSTKHIVWRANVDTKITSSIFAEKPDLGKRYASGLIKALRNDGLTTSCPDQPSSD